MKVGDRVIVNTGGTDCPGVIQATEEDWRRNYPHAFRVSGPAVLVAFDGAFLRDVNAQWIAPQYVRLA